MKHAQIAIINPAASPAMTGTPLLKPAPRNAAVLINTLAPEQTKPAEAARPVVENIQLVNVQVVIFGAEHLVLKKMLV